MLKSRPFLVNIIAVFLFVLVAYIVTDRLLDSYTRHGAEIKVPDLTGLTLEEAVNVLEEHNLRYEILDSLYDEERKPETILMSKPEAGDKVKEQRIIYLTMNVSEVPKVKMPDLIDRDIHQATLILENLGLRVGEITAITGPAEDNVRQQLFKGRSIAPNTQISKGSVISLVIEDGAGDSDKMKDELETPNLIDYNLEEARNQIEASGLELGSITVQGVVTDSSAAVVVSQRPAAFLIIRKGEKIDITIKQE